MTPLKPEVAELYPKVGVPYLLFKITNNLEVVYYFQSVIVLVFQINNLYWFFFICFPFYMGKSSNSKQINIVTIIETVI